ncbi:AAA family ATPase [Candidatus Laterigemmans baculatus]|uniref:AAA family ATPase n=1 Tax=Candidatus Laterigemmans baculatus TaxID=2770505 RepID=UPI001F33B2E1|nr:MoxR family ATPase [Candidatus Laterigemmans baculatus]
MRANDSSVETSTAADDPASAEDAAAVRSGIERAMAEIGRVVIGQDELIRGMLLGLLCNGHVLIEGVPGLAKTTAVATLARTVHTTFRRLQFTPDLLPSDVIGSEIYRPEEHRFEVQPGPIFANLVLVDEINRAPAKVQSALLEAMQERQVSIAGQTLPLPQPFMVLATQNPIDQQGTYALPEAQMDRFLLKLVVRYPARRHERAMLHQSLHPADSPEPIEPVLTPKSLAAAQAAIGRVSVSPAIEDYVVDLVAATRDPYRFGSEVGDLVRFGVSPRGTLALAHVARASAFVAGRDHVTPDDVKAVATAVFRHRIVLSYEALAEQKAADDVLAMILSQVPVP